ncbi:MAG: lipoyl(octanoyl) transferase LipB [Phycisphaerales bacterium]|nr:lipoyl(octanoyl) transferase LipB [Phycisphaerales bacterium]
MEPSSTTIEVRDLGAMRWADALQLQRDLQQEVIADRGAGGRQVLLLVEHDPPVVTVTRRPEAAGHVLLDAEALAARGIELEQTDRGGDVTWHGPGQLVAYPILDLNRLGLRLHEYMRWLEGTVIELLGEFGITGQRDESATGVWVPHGSGARKIAAMGVRVSRWVSMHGLALNVAPDLEAFEVIVPCGLHGRAVTSMAQELGDPPNFDAVKARLADILCARAELAMRAVESQA